jgi:uncharacterized membrane protein
MDQGETVHWETVLRPHRSLPPSGFLALMLVLAGVSFVSGIVFIRMGAWPICGFFGVDVMLVYFAFRLNYRSGRMCEVLRLAGAKGGSGGSKRFGCACSSSKRARTPIAWY